MAEWWTYRLSDFLLFSPRTYYRLFELYNADVWPAHLVALAIGLTIVALLRSPTARSARVISALLALCWTWIAWAFHVERYATINWAATYFGVAFALEAVLLLWLGVARNVVASDVADRRVAHVASFVVFLAVVLLPLAGFVEGRTWRQLESFALSPDPTVIATLGVLVPTAPRRCWLLWPIPLLWCAVSSATAWMMGSPLAPVLPLVAVSATILAIVGSGSPRIESSPPVSPTKQR